MKKRLIAWMFALLLVPMSMMAQSVNEMEAAKAMARSYGYGEKEIEEFLGDQKGKGSDAYSSELESVTKAPESTLLVKQAKRDDEETEEPEIYGHRFFSSKAMSIIPSINAPVPSNYVLGPGDDITIDVWGNSTAKINSVIARDGTVMINSVGPVLIGGQTVKRAESTLKTRLSRIYGDIGSGTHIKLTINRARSITINVVGDVVVPGVYALPALAQVTSAIFMAGGLEETASVREICVYRDGKVAGRFDLYRFIFDGFYPEGLKLQDNDIVSVPSYRSVVKVDGAAKRPMKYEILEGDTVDDVLTFAGGFGEDAETEQVFLDRRGTEKGTSFQIARAEMDRFAVMHGDLIYVNGQKHEKGDWAQVQGSVHKPGMYSITDGVSDVKSLIEAAGGLSSDAFKQQATLFRKDVDKLPVSVSIDLKEVLSGRTRVMLTQEDSLHVYSAIDLKDSTTIKVYGEVREEAVLRYRPGMSVYDAIMESGGLTEGADRSNIEVASRGRKDQGYVKRVDLENHPEQGLEPLLPEDAIFIRRLFYYREPQTIQIMGEVNYPGTYAIDKNVVRLSDIIQRAGMFTDDAYVKGAQLERTITKTEKARMEVAIELAGQEMKAKNKMSTIDSLKNAVKDLYSIGIDLEEAMKHPGSDADVILRTGDIITVPVMNNTVKISGAVFYPNTVVYNPKYSWRDYINQAGGRRRNTKANKIYAVYMNGLVAKRGSPYFKMEPGMELVVTSEPKEDKKLTTAEIVTIASSSTSIAYMITALVRMLM